MTRLAYVSSVLLALAFVLASCAPATDPLAPEPFLLAASSDAVVEAVIDAVEDADPVPPFRADFERNIFGTATSVGDYQQSSRWVIFDQRSGGAATTFTLTATSLGARLNVVGVPTGPADPVTHTVAVAVVDRGTNRTEVAVQGAPGPGERVGSQAMVDYLIEMLETTFPVITPE